MKFRTKQIVYEKKTMILKITVAFSLGNLN